MSGDNPEGFLGRWSRVKRTGAQSLPEPDPDRVAVPQISGEDDPAGVEGPVPVPDAAPVTLTEEELAALPRIEDLVQGSDIRPFLRMGVPRDLRNAAMRKIWMLTPGIRDHKDPAVDYAWDWNTPGGVPGDGVAPTAERAAEMLKALVAPRPQSDAAQAEDEQRDARLDPSDRSSPELAQGGPEARADLVEESGTSAEPVPVVEAAEEPEADNGSIPRRRHGSALPG